MASPSRLRGSVWRVGLRTLPLACRVEGVRYADDGAVAIVEWEGVQSAADVFQLFVDNCYPKPLQLECWKDGSDACLGPDTHHLEHR